MNILLNISGLIIVVQLAHILGTLEATISILKTANSQVPLTKQKEAHALMSPLTGTKADVDKKDSLTGTAPLPNEKQQGGN